MNPSAQKLRKTLAILAAFFLLLAPQISFSQTVQDSTKEKICLNFSPYYKVGQDPRRGDHIPPEQIRQGLEAIQPYCDCIRIFSSSTPLDTTAFIAKEMAFKEVIASAWLDRDTVTNNSEIEAALSLAKRGLVDRLVIGSETLLRGELSPEQLIAYINFVKEEVPDIPVSTADVYGEFIAHPEVIQEVEFLFINSYSYWEGESIECALQRFHQSYLSILEVAGDKEIIISETGWPTDGNTIGKAEPGLENLLSYLDGIRAWGKFYEIPFYWFSAFDEPWKRNSVNPQEAFWGIKYYEISKDSILCKEGVDSLLCSQIEIDTSIWTTSFIPNEADTPRIEFTQIPIYGDQQGILCGKVTGINPADCQLAAYIKVNGTWWVKPTFDQRTTRLSCDGTFCIDVTTGGLDRNATDYQIFLLGNGYDPPRLGNSPRLPDSLFEDAKTHSLIQRTPFDRARVFTDDMAVPRDSIFSVPVYSQDFDSVFEIKGGFFANFGLDLIGASGVSDSFDFDFDLIDEKNLRFHLITKDSIPKILPDSTLLFSLNLGFASSKNNCGAIGISGNKGPLEVVQFVEGEAFSFPLGNDFSQHCPLFSPTLIIEKKNTSPDVLTTIPVKIRDYINQIDMGGTFQVKSGVEIISLDSIHEVGTMYQENINDSTLLFRFTSLDSTSRFIRENETVFNLNVIVRDSLYRMGPIRLLDDSTQRSTQRYFGQFFTQEVFLDSIAKPYITVEIINFAQETSFNPIRLYPNPVQDEAILDFYAQEPGLGRISIWTITGQLLRERTIAIHIANNKIVIDDLEKLPKGLLLLRIEQESGQQWSTKLMRN